LILMQSGQHLFMYSLINMGVLRYIIGQTELLNLELRRILPFSLHSKAGGLLEL
jgi:hypothetical protein